MSKVEYLNKMQWGDQTTWKEIVKDESETTAAMEVSGVGVVVRVTRSTAEALTFIPFATIIDVLDSEGKLTGRRIAMRENMEYTYE